MLDFVKVVEILEENKRTECDWDWNCCQMSPGFQPKDGEVVENSFS